MYLRSVNIGLHLLNAFLFFLVLRLIKAHPLAVWLAPLIFLVHPVGVPAVTYISGRADPLALLFLLGGLVGVLRILRSEEARVDVRSLVWISGFYLCAALTRESSLLFPLIAGGLLLVVYRGQMKKLTPLLGGFLVVLLVYALARTLAFRDIDFAPGRTYPFDLRLLVLPYIWFQYMGHLLVPLSLKMEYALVVTDQNRGVFMLCWVLLPIFFSLVWLALRKDPVAKGLAVFFLLSLVPISNIFVHLNAPMSDHWLYIPQMGFFGLLTHSVAKRLPKGIALRS